MDGKLRSNLAEGEGFEPSPGLTGQLSRLVQLSNFGDLPVPSVFFFESLPCPTPLDTLVRIRLAARAGWTTRTIVHHLVSSVIIHETSFPLFGVCEANRRLGTLVGVDQSRDSGTTFTCLPGGLKRRSSRPPDQPILPPVIIGRVSDSGRSRNRTYENSLIGGSGKPTSLTSDCRATPATLSNLIAKQVGV